MADFPWDLSGEMWKHGDIASNIWDLEWFNGMGFIWGEHADLTGAIGKSTIWILVGISTTKVVIGVGRSYFTATKSWPNRPPQIPTPIHLGNL